jgi:flagellar motor switch protein FliN/FliY
MASGLETILALEVPVIVQIAERIMTVDEVTAIAPGAIIELPKSANDDLEIRVNNKTIGTGNAVKVGENYGIRVTFLGDLDDRITAMGANGMGQPAEDQIEEADRGDGA